MAIQRADTVIRANVASGFGTATDGHVWTIQQGDGQSVASDELVINGSTASTLAELGGSLATADAEALIRWMVTDATNTAGVFCRFTNTSNYYLARYDGGGHIAFFKDVAGTKTTVGSYALSPTLSQFYWLRFHVQGTNIMIRTWQDGTTEPATWNYSTTDSSLSGSGGSANGVGVYGFSNGSPNNLDHFSVDDLVSGVALAGELDSTLGMSGTLTVVKALASELDSTLGMSGTLTVVKALAGELDSTLGMSGTLTVVKALAGELDSTLGMSGTLTVGEGKPEDNTRRVPHRHIGRIEDETEQGESSLEGV